MGRKEKKYQLKPKKRGTSLVETVIALFLFAVFITGACKVLLAHRQLTDYARDHYTAVNIAKNQIEQIRNTMARAGYDQIYENGEQNIRVASDGEKNTDGTFRRSTTINKISEDMAEIVITVEIIDRRTRSFGSKSEMLRSYLARPRQRS